MDFVEEIDPGMAAANDALLEESTPVFLAEPAEQGQEDGLSEDESAALDAEDDLEDFDGSEPSTGVMPTPAPVPLESRPASFDVPLATLASRVLVKLALARSRSDAYDKVNAVLGSEGISLGPAGGGGGIAVRSPGDEHVVHGPDDLALLPDSLEPLRPLLKQIFRLRAAG